MATIEIGNGSIHHGQRINGNLKWNCELAWFKNDDTIIHFLNMVIFEIGTSKS